MEKIHNIHTGIVAEWLSLIDPQGANERDYDYKVAAILKSQLDLLLNSNMTEIRAKHWILTKKQTERGMVIDFSLIAYSAREVIPVVINKNKEEIKVKKLKRKLRIALEKEEYMKAAKIRDALLQLKPNEKAA